MRAGHDPLEGVRPDGTIVTGAHRDRLSIAFRPVLESALEHLASIDGAPSLYVYGSVATGTARPGSSDLLECAVADVVDAFDDRIGLWRPAAPPATA